MNKISRKDVVLLVVLVGVILVFSSRRPISPKDERIQYTIGIFSHTESANNSYVQTSELALRDINDFCESNGLNLRFSFKYDCAEDQPQNALEITQRFKSEGVNIIVGYGWNSMLDCVDQYGKNAGIVMVSPAGMNKHRGRYPHIFTLAPVESTQARALSLLVTNINMSRLVLFKPYSYSGYSMFENALNTSLTHNCVLADTIPYGLSSEYDVDEKYIQNLENVVRENIELGKTGVLFLGDDLDDILTSASNSSILSSVNWFATDQAVVCSSYIENSFDMKVYLLNEAPLDSGEYNQLVERYQNEYNNDNSNLEPYLYDSLWITAQTIINTQSGLNETIINEFPDVASTYDGATGTCLLDAYNERDSSTYQILCYTISNNQISLWKCGEVNSDKSVKWLTTPIQLK